MRTCFIIGFLLCIGGWAAAQNQAREQPYGNWVMYFGDNKFNQRWGIHSEFQARNYYINNTLSQTLARVGLHRYLNPTSMATMGYGFILTDPPEGEGGSRTIEHRIWEQFILRHRSYNVFIEHRYRLEQRFIKNVTTGQDLFDNRVRYRLQVLVPLYNFSPHLRHFFLATYNELFMNLGREISGQYFDRNRLYVALGYQLDPKFNLQFGVLNQVVALPDGLRPDVNYNFQISVVYNMDNLAARFTSK